MRDWLGFPDARVTPKGPDGGVDVTSSRALAQVKWQGAAVGRPELQRLFGARGHDSNKQLLFFAASGYSMNAITYADQVGIALFTYNPVGELTCLNGAAETLTSRPSLTDSDRPDYLPSPSRLKELFLLRNPPGIENYTLSVTDKGAGMLASDPRITPDFYLFIPVIGDVGIWFSTDDPEDTHGYDSLRDFVIDVDNGKPDQDQFIRLPWLAATIVKHVFDRLVTSDPEIRDFKIRYANSQLVVETDDLDIIHSIDLTLTENGKKAFYRI